jgi:hypothetical protein
MTLKDHSLAAGAKEKPKTLLDTIKEVTDEQELLRIYQAVQVKLQLDVNKVNLTEALVVQYKQGRHFLDEILADPTIPANQRAQAFNAVNASVEKIAKMRGIVMSQERLKIYENAFLKAVETLKEEKDPVTMLDTFMDLYGKNLNDRGR